MTTRDAFSHFARKVRDGAIVPLDDLDVHEVARARTQELERKRERKLLQDLLDQQSAVDQVVEAVRDIVPSTVHIDVPLLAPPVVDPEHSTPQTAVLLLSDVHLGEVISPEETGGLGRYNFETFLERRDLYIEKVRSIIRHHQMANPVNKVVIAWLGDMIDGDDIFASQRLSLDMDLMSQVFVGASEMAKIPLSLLDLVEDIDNYCVVGNHGRVGRKGSNKSYVNFDYVQYKTIELALATYADRIHWSIPESFFTIADIEGFNWLLWHGDDVKGWAGIPAYGIQKALTQWLAIFNRQGRKLDVACIGHFHQHAELSNSAGEVYMNGAWPGTNEFSLRLKAANPPQQTLMFVHPRMGVTAKYSIRLDEPASQAA